MLTYMINISLHDVFQVFVALSESLKEDVTVICYGRIEEMMTCELPLGPPLEESSGTT